MPVTVQPDVDKVAPPNFGDVVQSEEYKNADVAMRNQVLDNYQDHLIRYRSRWEEDGIRAIDFHRTMREIEDWRDHTKYLGERQQLNNPKLRDQFDVTNPAFFGGRIPTSEMSQRYIINEIDQIKYGDHPKFNALNEKQRAMAANTYFQKYMSARMDQEVAQTPDAMMTELIKVQNGEGVYGNYTSSQRESTARYYVQAIKNHPQKVQMEVAKIIDEGKNVFDNINFTFKEAGMDLSFMSELMKDPEFAKVAAKGEVTARQGAGMLDKDNADIPPRFIIDTRPLDKIPVADIQKQITALEINEHMTAVDLNMNKAQRSRMINLLNTYVTQRSIINAEGGPLDTAKPNEEPNGPPEEKRTWRWFGERNANSGNDDYKKIVAEQTKEEKRKKHAQNMLDMMPKL